MTCYNMDCKHFKSCDKWRQSVCIHKMSKLMYKAKKKIQKERNKCFKCGGIFEKGTLRKSRIEILFCPKCKNRIRV